MKRQYKVHANLGSMQLTKKITITAASAHDAVIGWLAHKQNTDFSKYTPLTTRHEGFDHEGDTTIKVFRTEARDPWSLNSLVIWTQETL